MVLETITLKKGNNMKTLKLFNSVESKITTKTEPFIDYENGLIIKHCACWAIEEIISYYNKERLSGNDLNKTFHKSWKTVTDSSRLELVIHQIMHYISTYGSNFEDEIYIPDEVLEIPEVRLKFKVINGVSKDELIDKSLNMLKSGVALAEKTLMEILDLLDELNYKFTGKEGIRNKEAVVKIAEVCGVYPDDPAEFFRYVIYRSTGETLLIKNNALIENIKASDYNPSLLFKKYGTIKLAEVFNRFKPLFLAYKNKCSKTINEISRLSKTNHKALFQNPLNAATSVLLKKEDLHWLDNATPFALFKVINACYARANGQNSFVYRIRNGKSWTKESKTNTNICEYNFFFLLQYLKGRFNLSGKNIYVPEGIEYALPTSEKMFVGNIPTGSRFSGDKLAVGVYWENSWGARDIDLSGLSIDGKIGWDSGYYNKAKSLIYSGDITNAPKGAVEYLYAKNGLKTPTLVMSNIYNGEDDSAYKIIIGKGDDVSRNYMMNPNNLCFEVKTQTAQKQSVLGIFMPNGEEQSFVLLNFGAGSARVGGYNDDTSRITTNALYEQYNDTLTVNFLVHELGARLTNEERCNINLSIDALEKDTFIKLFS